MVGEEGESKDPGAARYGNFINYYTFNPPENRMKNIPSDILTKLNVPTEPLTVLDIGCNAGDLTFAMRESLTCDKSVQYVGIDLDKQLIDRAVNNFSSCQNLQFLHLDIMQESFMEEITKVLRNLNKTKFDLVTVFSVTMWIHLNHGDQGLMSFINKLCSISSHILVEPQPWKCYQTAARRMRKLGKQEFEQMKNLKFRGKGVDNEIVKLFENQGFLIQEDFGESEWNRRLVLLKGLEH